MIKKRWWGRIGGVESRATTGMSSWKWGVSIFALEQGGEILGTYDARSALGRRLQVDMQLSG